MSDPVPGQGPSRLTGTALAVWGAVALYAAFTLAVEKVHVLTDPSYQLGCDINPVISCGSVMNSDQAEAFGFPNPFLGIGAFGVVITLGVLLAAGVALPRWVLDGLALGAVLGLGFVGWLISQSLYEIDALCPWCMVVWSMTIPIAVWSVLGALRAHLPANRTVALAWTGRYLVVLVLYLVVVVLALVRFWYYWETLL